MFREEVISFLNNKETYNKVLDIINKECQKNGTHINSQPIEDFLCGGAVANTLHSLIRGGDPVINDVDLFRFNHQTNQFFEVDYENLDYTINQSINNQVVMDSYGRSWLGSSGEYFGMVSTSRESIINTTDINVVLRDQEFSLEKNYKPLLENFDINCTMVGLDRVSGVIVYTDKFVEFLVTNKMEVTRVDHPLQTTYRLFKKSNELFVDKTNIEEEVLLLQHNSLTNGFISKRNLDKYLSMWELLGNYFTLPEQSSFDKEILVYESKPYEKVFGGRFLFRNSNELVNFWDFFIRDKHNPHKQIVLEYYSNIKGYDLQSVGNTPCYDTIVTCLGYHRNYLDCEFSIEDLVEVDKFFTMVESESSTDISLFVMGNIVDQKKYIDFITKKFIDSFGIFDSTKFRDVLGSSVKNGEGRTTLISLDVNDRIGVMKRMLNGYIVLKGSRLPKLSFIKN